MKVSQKWFGIFLDIGNVKQNFRRMKLKYESSNETFVTLDTQILYTCIQAQFNDFCSKQNCTRHFGCLSKRDTCIHGFSLF